MDQRRPSTPHDTPAVELPAQVLETAPAVQLAAPPSRPPATPPSQPAPEDLRAHTVLRYATTEDAERYRRIMRVLFLEHQAFGLRLRPDQVGERLHERFGLREAAELLEERLARLAEWGAVDREHDPSLATTAAE